MLEVFFKSLIIGYSGALMPGSLLTYTIDKSIRRGALSGLIISIGHSLLELVLVVLLLLGFGKYLDTGTARIVIGAVGGCVLGFLGVNMVRDAYLNRININFQDNAGRNTVKRDKISVGRDKWHGNMLFGGAVISASNPYFIVWWAAVGLGLIMAAYSAFGIAGVVVFYIGHIICDISWYSFVSVMVSRTRKLISLKAYRVVIAILGIFLVGFGLSFIYGSISIVI